MLRWSVSFIERLFSQKQNVIEIKMSKRKLSAKKQRVFSDRETLKKMLTNLSPYGTGQIIILKDSTLFSCY